MTRWLYNIINKKKQEITFSYVILNEFITKVDMNVCISVHVSVFMWVCVCVLVFIWYWKWNSSVSSSIQWQNGWVDLEWLNKPLPKMLLYSCEEDILNIFCKYKT